MLGTPSRQFTPLANYNMNIKEVEVKVGDEILIINIEEATKMGLVKKKEKPIELVIGNVWGQASGSPGSNHLLVRSYDGNKYSLICLDCMPFSNHLNLTKEKMVELIKYRKFEMIGDVKTKFQNLI